MSDLDPLVSDEDAFLRLMATNARRQHEKIRELFVASDQNLEFTPDIVKALHFEVMQGLYSFAGEFRAGGIKIQGSRHKPPASKYVPGLVAEMCETANAHAEDWSALKTAAYLLWRLNWIHPFADGNGRTARALAYLALCLRLGFFLPSRPGSPTIMTLIDSNRDLYEAALQDADEAALQNIIDVDPMIRLLDRFLSEQLEPFRNPGGKGT